MTNDTVFQNEAELEDLEKLMAQLLFRTSELTVQHPAVPYQYRPIASPSAIRLLQVKAGEAGEPVAAKLLDVPLSHLPQYEALSYAWGKPDKVASIQLDGGSTLGMTESLSLVLPVLRDAQNDRLVWIDQLCINQSDTDEKSQQILHMPQIYASAERVLCWIGEESASGDAIKALLLTEAIGKTDFQSFPRVRPLERGAWIGNAKLPAARDDAWGNLMRFWARAYFRRLWIVQECVNGAEVVILCGRWSTPWKRLARGVNHINECNLLKFGIFGDPPVAADPARPDVVAEFKRANAGLLCFQSISDIIFSGSKGARTWKVMKRLANRDDISVDELDYEMWTGNSIADAQLTRNLKTQLRWWRTLRGNNRNAAVSLFQSQCQQIDGFLSRPRSYTYFPRLLSHFWQNETSEPRDRFFALLGISTERANPALKPDYSLSVDEIARRYAAVYMSDRSEMNDMGLAVLAEAGLANMSSPTDHLPTWITRSHVALGAKGVPWVRTGRQDFKLEDFEVLPGGGQLRVRGATLRHVTAVINGGDFELAEDLEPHAASVQLWGKQVPPTIQRIDALVAKVYPDYPVGTADGGRELAEDFQWRLMIANRGFRDDEIPDASWRTSYRAWRDSMGRLALALRGSEQTAIRGSEAAGFHFIYASGLTNDTAGYQQRWMEMAMRYDVMVTSCGLVGLAPKGTVAGDVVASFKGAISTFVLRDAGGEFEPSMHGQHKLVGSAYIHRHQPRTIMASGLWNERDFFLV